MTIVNQLRVLGLGDYEAAVYAVLLETSPQSATVIAKKCALSRSSVYTTLSSLIAKGLVGTSHKNEVKQFVALGHDALMSLVEKDQREAEKRVGVALSLKESIAAMGAAHASTPAIVTFEGQVGLKKIYLSMLREAKRGAVMCLIRDEFVWRDDWNFIFEEEWHTLVGRLKKEKNITTRLLVNPSSIEHGHDEAYRSNAFLQYRYLPQASAVKDFGMYVLHDIVSILSFEHNNLVGTRIANKNLAENYRRIFEGLWDASGQH